MVQVNECPKCGTTLPPDAPAGVCPRCLLKAGLAESVHETEDDATLITSAEQDQDRHLLPAIEPEMSGATDAPSSGTKVRYFGDYELLEEIARGGMGVVYKARQTRLNRVVALKLILAGQLASEADVRRFQIEAEAAAQLDHPGIVPVFEVGDHAGHHFYSMAHVNGESLAQRITKKPLPPPEAAELVRKIAAAVAFAHAKGVIHRDLKPSNILIDHADEPRVADFGLAKQKVADSSLTESGQTLGTPSFMAPEQASGMTDQVSESADIYSLGAILYCALTGRPPFLADTPAKTVWRLLHDEPTLPRKVNADIPIDLEAICLKCLEKSPTRRYASASALHDDLSRFLNHQAITARRPTLTDRVIRWSRRNRRSISLVLVTSVVVLIAVAGFQRAKEWYDTYWMGHVSISLASGPTEIVFYREKSSVPAQSVTIATDARVDLPSGDYEIWAKRYGQRWRANVLPRQTLELSFEDSDRHDFALRTAGYLGDLNQVSPIRRQRRTDLLLDTSSFSNGRTRRMLELHHGWNGDRLWGVEIPAWSNEHPDGKRQFLEFPGGEITSDFNGDGVADLAVLKASHYMVVSTESGEVLLDEPLDFSDRFGASQLSFGEFMDVTQDGVLDIVLLINLTLLAFDGSDGTPLWRTELPRAGQVHTVPAQDEQLLVIVTGPDRLRDTKGAILTYSLSDGVLLRNSALGDAHVEVLGFLVGSEEPLLLVNYHWKEFRAIGVSSGQVRWTVSEERWSHFCVRDNPGGWLGTLVLEDLTGDGVTDAVMASPPSYGYPYIELMMIDGRQGRTVWRSKLEARQTPISNRPAVYGESASAPGQVGKLFSVDFELLAESAQGDLRLNSINPKTGDITWKTSLSLSQGTSGAWFHPSRDGSQLPALVIETAGDLYKRTLLHVDKETGLPFRRISDDRSFIPVLMLADFDHDGLADFLAGEQPQASNSGGVAGVNVSLYRGQPRECWRRPAVSFPLPDLDNDGVSDCMALGPAPTVVSGLTGETLQRLPVVTHDPDRTTVTSGSTGDGHTGLVVQVAEEGYGELHTIVRAIDVASGKLVAEIDDRLKERGGPMVSTEWTRLFFPDLDGDGRPEIAVTGNKPWRVYSTKTRKRLLVGSGLSQEAELFSNPAFLIGCLTGQDGRDRLIEVGAAGPIRKTVTVRAIGEQGRADWSTELPLRDGSQGFSAVTGVRSDDFDNDGVKDVILWSGFDLWVLEQDSGKLKLHTSRNGQITSSAVFMVRTEEGRSALAVPYRTLISPDGQVTTNAYVDVIRYPHPRNPGEIYVWIKDDGRIVAYGSDGVTRLWEQRLPEIASTTALEGFMHEGDWNDAVVVGKGNDLFAMDLLTGRKLWRSSIPLSAAERVFLLPRKQYSTPLILSTSKNVTVCRESYPVDDKWNYSLPSSISIDSAKDGTDQLPSNYGKTL